MRPILVAFDESTHADDTLRWAGELARILAEPLEGPERLRAHVFRTRAPVVRGTHQRTSPGENVPRLSQEASAEASHWGPARCDTELSLLVTGS